MLDNPDARRGLRAMVQAVVLLVLVAALLVVVQLLRDDAPALRWIATGALIIIGLGEIFYGYENGVRARISLTRDGASIDTTSAGAA